MKNLLKYIQNVNNLEKMWFKGDIAVLCVSGGSDSMCLLNIFESLKRKKYIKTIIIAHVNYGLRGEDSKNDEKLVRKYAKKNKLHCEVLLLSKEKKGKNENEWRDIRYNFFKKIAEKYNANLIVLGHNKNDQAETLLLNLLRGSGLEGLRGMPYKKNKIIRPLLGVEKKDIIKYCNKEKIEYRNDYTNKDTSFLRNKVRIELLPYLKNNYNLKIVDVLARTSFILADNYDNISKQRKKIWNYCGNIVECEKDEFLRLSAMEQREELRTIIQKITRSKYKKSFNAIEEYRKAILSDKNKLKNIYVASLKFEQKNGKVRFMLV